MPDVNQTCECDSWDCLLKVGIPVKEAQKIRKDQNSVIIVDGCKTGPSKGDVLVEQRDGYRIYRQRKAARHA